MANERVLVVDDEQGVVRSCVRILQRQGFVVSGRTDSLSVPGLLKQETFDLLLTDIKMPKIDGLELLKIAKEIDPHMTVVLITGYGTMEDAIKAIRLGAQGFLMKPFDAEELISAVTESLSRRALLRDSLRLQTMLPLLEINQILQISGGEIPLVKRILEIALRSTGAARMAWLRSVAPPSSGGQEGLPYFVEAVVAGDAERSSTLPVEAMASVLKSARPVWVLVDGTLTENPVGQPNVKGALLPLVIKGEVVGVLTAETGGEQAGPFGQISLDLLTVLTGQLTIVLENVQLFQQTETLRAFNEDIIKNMTNGLIAVDKGGCVTAFNPAASAMLGYPLQAVLYQPLDQVLHGAEELVKIFNQALLSKKPESYREILIKTYEGRQLPISVNIAPLGDNSGGQPAGVVGVIEDLSELKALEERRRRLDRLAALGEMAAVVAHEIRNPVASIAAGVEYLARNAPAGSVELQGSSMILGEVKRVNRILEDILFVARPLQLELKPEALPDLIQNVLQRCQPQIQENQIKTSFQCETDLPFLYIDGQRLEQVFTNLIINATQAMRDGGQLEVKVSRLPAPNGIMRPLESEGGTRGGGAASQDEDRVQVMVTDTGPGIPAEAQARIFEPFFTTKARGTGLGLSIARRIIEEHRGTITVETKKGQGTSFIIQLPIKEFPRDNQA